ncbi:putative transmembrane dehydrogenase (Large subunit) oxidoreductase domain protein [Burkholderia cepacia]|nr:putative transmembrane dehydrogenase (Large subunit) oxidoreductase domain protein [Burkholderia cepacia]
MYIAPIGQIGMQLLFPQQVGRPSYGRLLRATGSVTTWNFGS